MNMMHRDRLLNEANSFLRTLTTHIEAVIDHKLANVAPATINEDMISEDLKNFIKSTVQEEYEDSKEIFVDYARDELAHEFVAESDIDEKIEDAIENVFDTMRFTIKPDQ